MKRHIKTTDVGPGRLPRGSAKIVGAAATAALARRRPQPFAGTQINLGDKTEPFFVNLADILDHRIKVTTDGVLFFSCTVRECFAAGLRNGANVTGFAFAAGRPVFNSAFC